MPRKRKILCEFCNTKGDLLNYGELYKLRDVAVHYYCVLLSTNMAQRGKDHEGIFGFLLDDIIDELKKSEPRKCCYCKKNKASIFCCHPKCKKIFHLPCGIKNFCLNQFTDDFKSFCFEHRPLQKIEPKILKEAEKSKVICPVCYENFTYSQNVHSRLWAPCCGKAWFHKKCIQLLANSAGYFFKCPICNNTKKFRYVMSRLGIFIPQRDASWELEPNAYQDLLFRYNKCDAPVCFCTFGREQSIQNSKWEIVLCHSCGSQGVHKRCANLSRKDSKWECSLCSKVGQKNEPTSNGGLVSKITNKDTEAASRKSGESSVKCSSSSRRKNNRKRSFTSGDEKHKRKKIKSLETAGVENSHESQVIEGEMPAPDPESLPLQVLCADKKIFSVSESEESEEIDVVTVETNEPERNILEAFSKLKPGPLSYKLNLIRNIYGHSFPAAQIDQGTELSSDMCESSKSDDKLVEPEVIDLMDSDDGEEEKSEDEENSKNSDVDILQEFERLTANQCSNTSSHDRKETEFKDTGREKILGSAVANSVTVSLPNTQVPGNLASNNVQKLLVLPLSIISNFEIVGSLNLLLENNNTEEV